jgi:hypothetical protein
MKTAIILLCILLILAFIVIDSIQSKYINKRAFEQIDQLHKQEWNGEPDDELIAWFRVRNRVMTRRDATLKEYVALDHAVRTRIDQCRARNKRFSTVHRGPGRFTTISTQN